MQIQNKSIFKGEKKMKKLYKILSVVLCAILVVMSFAACAPQEDNTPHKIAVMQNAADEAALSQKKYLEEYVGPYFNCEFVFSEVYQSEDKALTFIEQAKSAGCEAVISFYANFQDTIINACEEYGMYVITNSSTAPSIEASYDLGRITTPTENTVSSYKTLVQNVIKDGKNHNFVLCSGGAAGARSNQHLQTTIAVLEMLQENYNVNFGVDIKEVAKTQVGTELTAGDISVYIYPGFPNANYATGFQNVLQTGDGKYDVVLVVAPFYSQIMNPIKQVEQAKNMDVKLISLATIDDNTKAAFESGALDGAVINPTNMLIGEMFAVVYNALQGHADVIRENGKPGSYPTVKWACESAEEYAKIAKIDVEEGLYSLTVEQIEECLISKNSKIDANYLKDYFGKLDAKYTIDNVFGK